MSKPQMSSKVTLRNLIKNLSTKKVAGDLSLKIRGISYNSQKVKKNDLFVAISGFRQDGHKYIRQAIRKGACAIVAERNGDYQAPAKILVPDSRLSLAQLSNRFFNYPSQKLKVIGVTGTNGKTTTTYLIKSILEEAGEKTGLIGTIAYLIDGKKIPATNTTPESLDLQQLFYEMQKEKVKNVVMEVSSHSLALNRVWGIDFDIAVFTNLNREHLDFHKTMKNYRDTKGMLFESLKGKDKFAIINKDDKNWKFFYKKSKVKNLTYSLEDKTADFHPLYYNLGWDGSFIEFKTPSGIQELNLQLLGRFNLYNSLASWAVGYASGLRAETIKEGLEKVKNVSGRIQTVKFGQPFNVIIDYAHTPEAFRMILQAARELTSGKIVIVFGCGGDRDQGKRSVMGKIASEKADFVVLTTDNPRSEDPKRIVKDITAGMKKRNYEIVMDRKKAIQKAVSYLKEDDTLILAGKGHENYQIIKDKKYHFSDKETVEEILAKKGYKNA